MSTGKPFKVSEAMIGALVVVAFFAFGKYILPSAPCEEEAFRLKRYHFVIKAQRRDQGKFAVFEGTDSSGKKELFREVKAYKMLANTVVGDTLLKEKGSTDVYIVHGQQRMRYEFACKE